MASPSTLRAQALLEFGLPVAPQRVDELPCGPGLWIDRVQAPAGRFQLVCAEGALAVAFEATLFDLLAESRYPAPRPRRSKGGGLIAKLARPGRLRLGSDRGRAASCRARGHFRLPGLAQARSRGARRNLSSAPVRRGARRGGRPPLGAVRCAGRAPLHRSARREAAARGSGM